MHTDTTAAEVARDLNARAFSVGHHIGFAPGEYRPGSIVGDAIIAHELAHRLQQDESRAASPEHASLESEADRFAAGLLGRMVSPDAASVAMPTMRTGLKLQGCDKGKATPDKPGMGLDEGLGANEDSKEYTVEEYRELWAKKMGRQWTAEDTDRLADGCVGITNLNLGEDGNPDLSACYDSFENATKAAAHLQSIDGEKRYMFAMRFYATDELKKKKEYEPDENGKIWGMLDYWRRKDKTRPNDGKGPYVNFDFGWYDEVNDTWWHANHCDPETGDKECREKYKGKPMKIYQSTKAHFTRKLRDFEGTKPVFCITTRVK